jgi:hypothetical protein
MNESDLTLQDQALLLCRQRQEWSPFCRSLLQFYGERGFLTSKQITAVLEWKPKPGGRMYLPYDEEEQFGDGNPMDYGDGSPD